MRPGCLLLCAILFSCASDDGSDNNGTPIDVEPDSNLPVDEAICDRGSGRAILRGPFQCAAGPEYVRIDTRDHAYEMFTYEASHPRATDTQAFPCAASQGMRYEAPDQETEPCSISGLRPWHSVTWSDANAACSLIGWRLCSSDELLRACGGPDSTAYAFGAVFEGTICNLRGTYRAEGETFASSSPTGHFPECVSAEGLYDLTGNLWEWVSDALEGDDLGHIYQGAGWKTIAERHRDSDQVCSVRTQLHGTNATNFTQPFVGFRCCRDAN